MDYLIDHILDNELEIDDLRNTGEAKWLQKSLNHLLGMQLKIDGNLGGKKAKSRAAITIFQELANIPVTHRADRKTVSTLKSLLSQNKRLGLPIIIRLDHFGQNKFTVDRDHHGKVCQLFRKALYLRRRHRIDSLLIAGHASREGSSSRNRKLSLERADEVFRHLLTAWKCIRKKPISVFADSFFVREIPLGENHPIPQASREKNRRVELLLLKMNRTGSH